MLAAVTERWSQNIALRIARELGCLREYVRGDRDAIRDIAASWDLYALLVKDAG